MLKAVCRKNTLLEQCSMEQFIDKQLRSIRCLTPDQNTYIHIVERNTWLVLDNQRYKHTNRGCATITEQGRRGWKQVSSRNARFFCLVLFENRSLDGAGAKRSLKAGISKDRAGRERRKKGSACPTNDARHFFFVWPWPSFSACWSCSCPQFSFWPGLG